MCAGCMGTADFLFTSGVLGAASLKVAGRRLLPGNPRRDRKVTDAEADEFVARLKRATPEPVELDGEHRRATTDRAVQPPSTEPGSPEGEPVLV